MGANEHNSVDVKGARDIKDISIYYGIALF